MFFGQAMRAGTGRAEVDGAETFVNTGRHIGTNQLHNDDVVWNA
jgi:hypothetical protein